MISTKEGDDGTTTLFPSSQRVSKADKRLDCAGAVDKLMSVLGLATLLCKSESTKADLRRLQKHLKEVFPAILSPEDLPQSELDWIDSLYQSYQQSMDAPNQFVLPGNTLSSACIDITRTIARDVEREVVKLKEISSVDKPLLLKFLNRLSDVLFLMARAEEEIKENKHGNN